MIMIFSLGLQIKNKYSGLNINIMKRSFYHGMFVFLFYVIFSVIAVKTGNPNPLTASMTITILTFFWFKISVNWESLFSGPNDVFINVIIYTIILSVVASLSIFFSKDVMNLLNISLYLSPVILWFLIWTDYFFQKMKGN
jgi:hypothetical protein